MGLTLPSPAQHETQQNRRGLSTVFHTSRLSNACSDCDRNVPPWPMREFCLDSASRRCGGFPSPRIAFLHCQRSVRGAKSLSVARTMMISCLLAPGFPHWRMPPLFFSVRTLPPPPQEHFLETQQAPCRSTTVWCFIALPVLLWQFAYYCSARSIYTLPGRCLNSDPRQSILLPWPIPTTLGPPARPGTEKH